MLGAHACELGTGRIVGDEERQVRRYIADEHLHESCVLFRESHLDVIDLAPGIAQAGSNRTSVRYVDGKRQQSGPVEYIDGSLSSQRPAASGIGPPDRRRLRSLTHRVAGASVRPHSC